MMRLFALAALLLASTCSGQSTNLAGSFPGTITANSSHIALPALNIGLPFTVEAWIYPVPGYNDYASMFFSRSGLPTGFFMRSTQSVANELRSVWNDLQSTTSTGLSVPLNQWSHVAMVVTQNRRVLYLNQKSYSYSSSTNNAPQAFAGPSYIGWDPALPQRTFKGMIDEVRIWNVEKTAADFDATLYTGLVGNETGLVAYYTFDDANTAAITDVSTNQRNGVSFGVTYAPSTFNEPQKVSVATSQSAADAASIFQYVAPYSERNPLARMAVTVVNAAPPALKLTSITIDLQNSSLSAVTKLNVYFTGSNWEYFNTTLFASELVSPSDLSVTLTGLVSLPVGVSYLWLTGDIAKNAQVGTQISVVVSSVSSETAVFPVTSTTTAPVTVLDASYFSTLVNSHLSIATSNAQTSKEGANFVAFQQNAITTFNGWQYMGYWNRQLHLVLSRRTIPTEEYGVFGEWQEIEFMDFTITTTRAGDNHYSISVGICPNDGTIHLAFDMHGDPLRYRLSIPNMATDPENAQWTTDSFGPRLNNLVLNTTEDPVKFLREVTYPRFVQMPNGDLMLEHRYGTSGAGNNFLWQYKSGNWSMIGSGEYANGLSLNPNENAYVFGVHFRGERLHVSWCWRLTPDPLTNHDMYYAYSDDVGLTWKNSIGETVAETGVTPLSLANPGLKIWTIGTNRGLINQESQVVDSKNGIHILVTYMHDSAARSTNFWGGRTPTIQKGSGALLRHMYQLENGTWANDIVGPASVNRAQIAIDGADNLYIVAPNWRVFFASAASGWKVWTTLDHSQSTAAQNEGLIDRELLLNHNILSFVFANTASQVLVPSYAKALPKLPVNTCCYSLTQPSLPSTWLPYPSGDITLNPGNPISPVNPGQGCNSGELEYWDSDSETWRSNYTDTNGANQVHINSIYASGTSLKVRTIQSTQHSLYALLNNRLARLPLTCNNGMRGCMMIQFGSVPGVAQNIEKLSTCPL